MPGVADEDPAAEAEQADSKSRAHDQQSRWQWLDPGKQPLAGLRWLAVLGIALAWWIRGAPTSPAHAWLPYVVIAGAVILPDIAGFAVGGFRLDLKQAQHEIAALRQDVNAQARASSLSVIALGNDALEKLRDLTPGALKPLTDQASGPRAPWPPRTGSTDTSGDIP